MNLTCYIVDDEYHAIEVLKTFIQDTPGLELLGYDMDPRIALDRVAGPDAPDVTFLDVDMPGLNGMEFAGLSALYTKIIFTTSYPEYAIDAFEKEAFDYLLKPIGYQRFVKTVMKLKKYFHQLGAPGESNESFFYIKSDVKGKLVKIVKDDIYYLEAASNYVIIHLAAGKQMAYLTMEEIAEKLSKTHFIRIHRSFIINDRRIKSLEQGQITLDNQAIVPLGRLYKGSLLDAMNELLVKSKRSPG